MSILDDEEKILDRMSEDIVFNKLIYPPTRKSGRSTRLIWYYIDKFISPDVKEVIVKDHYCTYTSNEALFRKFTSRLNHLLYSVFSLHQANPRILENIYQTNITDVSNSTGGTCAWKIIKLQYFPVDGIDKLKYYNDLINDVIYDFFKNNCEVVGIFKHYNNNPIELDNYKNKYPKDIIQEFKDSDIIHYILMSEFKVPHNKIQVV